MIESQSKRIVMESIKRVMDNEDELNAKDIIKKVAYYNGNYSELVEYIRPYLDFEAKELEDMPWQFANITKKVIQKNSFCYKKPPNRTVEAGDAKYPDWTIGKDKIMRITERQTNLLFDVAFFVGWDKDNDRFLYKPPIRYFKPLFNNDDQVNPIGIMFPVDTPLNKEARWEKWTAKEIEYLTVDKSGLVRKDPKRETIPNEFGFFNFVFIHKGELIDTFRTGSSDDLINANEILNLSLTVLNYLERDTSYKQPWGTGIQETESVVSRYNRMLSSTNPAATFGVLDLQTNLASNIEKIKFNVSLCLSNWNMEPKWSSEGDGAPSGFSLVVKNMDLLEAWEQAVPVWREVEDEIFVLEQKIAKKMSKGAIDGFNVNFSDISFPIDKKEQREDWEWQLGRGYINDLDVMKKLDIDGTEEELKQRLADNKVLKSEMTSLERPKPLTFEERLGGVNA